MSLKPKIEAVIYASEEPVTLQQLAGLLGEEAAAELDALARMQSRLPLGDELPELDVTTPDEHLPPGTLEDRPVHPASQLQDAEGTAPQDGEASHSRMDFAPSIETGGEVGVTPGIQAADTVADQRVARERERRIREHLRRQVDALMRDYAENERGIEIREVAGGFRMGTKPEYHDAVRGFVKSLKPALKLTLQALETLAVIAYKQPVTAAEISEIRGVDSSGVLGGLMARKLIATAGRKQVIGRPMLYKTTKEFLVRFGLKDVLELPSMEEFERLAGELSEQEDLPMEPTAAIVERANARGDADHIREATTDVQSDNSSTASINRNDFNHANKPAEPGGTADEQATDKPAEQDRRSDDIIGPAENGNDKEDDPEESTVKG